jgi:ribosomal protein S18 acetylase RimI-like enzyme
MLIESVTPQDRGQLLLVAVSTGLFTSEEAESLLGEILDGLASKTMPPGHQAISCRFRSIEAPVGWSYFAPDSHATDVWNLWWIGVSPRGHGKGVGALLLQYAENKVASLGGRIVVVETSAAEELGRARRFYGTQGYLECGRVPDFYAEGEAKVIFARRPRAT